MKATLLQLLGLVGFIVACTLKLGAEGFLAGLSLASVYVGLAMES